MTDPQRWLEDPQVSDDVRELLQAGDAPPRMGAEARQRLATYVTGVATGVGASSALLSTKVVAALLAVSVGGAVTWVTVERAQRQSRPATPAVQAAGWRDVGAGAPRTGAEGFESVAAPAAASVADANSAVPSPLAEGPLDPSDALSRAAPGVAPSRSTSTSSAPARVAARPKGASSFPASVAAHEDSLAAEAALLEQARARLALDPEAALSGAELHASTFPAGQLSAERELIAIDALKRMGRLAAARQRAQALIGRDHNGIYARRARRLLEAM